MPYRKNVFKCVVITLIMLRWLFVYGKSFLCFADWALKSYGPQWSQPLYCCRVRKIGLFCAFYFKAR